MEQVFFRYNHLLSNVIIILRDEVTGELEELQIDKNVMLQRPGAFTVNQQKVDELVAEKLKLGKKDRAPKEPYFTKEQLDERKQKIEEFVGVRAKQKGLVLFDAVKVTDLVKD